MDAVIVELKPTTIAYLQAHQELVPKSCDYTGSAMIVMPAIGANYLVRFVPRRPSGKASKI